MREIKSPATFKSCYIADVKEEMGIPVKKKVAKRKIQAPDHIKPFIRQALENLPPGATIKQIQEEALKLYQEHISGDIQKYFGAFRTDDVSLVRSIAEDKGIFYGVEDQGSH